MKLAHAKLIAEMLHVACYVDDAGEVFGGMLDGGVSQQAVREKAAEVDELIAIVNAILPEKEQVKLYHGSMADQVEELIKYNY